MAILARATLLSIGGAFLRGAMKHAYGRARYLTHVAILVFASLSWAARSEAGGKAGTITYQNLVPGGIAIGGVTSHIDGPTSQPGSRESMARMFEESFLQSRTDIPLMGADRVRSAVGGDTYESMLDQLKSRGEVSGSTLDSLRAALVDSVRYLVVARIEKEKALRYTVERDTDYDPKTYNFETFNIASRTVEVGFRVYDLHDGKLAWNVRRTDSEEQEARLPKPSTIFKSFTVAGQLETALSDDKGPDPGMPDVFGNLAVIFDQFTRALPKRRK